MIWRGQPPAGRRFANDNARIVAPYQVTRRHAFVVFGSYFPAWMVCSVIGLVITVIVRLLLVGLGIHPHLRPKALVYVCFAILFTMGVWLVFFKK